MKKTNAKRITASMKIVNIMKKKNALGIKVTRSKVMKANTPKMPPRRS